MAEPVLHVPESEVIMADVHPLAIEVLQNPYYQSSKPDDQADTSTKVDTSEGEITAAGGKNQAAGIVGDKEKEIAAASTLQVQSEENSVLEVSSEPVTGGNDENRVPTEATTAEQTVATGTMSEGASSNGTEGVPTVSDAGKTVATIGAGPADSETAAKDGDETTDSENVGNSTSESVIQQQQPGIVSGSIKPVASPVPVIAHASSATTAADIAATLLKDGPRPSKENERMTKMPAEKLKVGEAELLSLSHLQQKQAAALRFAEGTGGKVTQVAVIPPIVDPTRTVENRSVNVVVGDGPGGMGLAQVLNIEKRANVVPEEATKDSDVVITSVTKATMPSMAGMAGMASMTGMIKISSQQTVKKHWTTSWKPLSTAALERIGLDSKGNGYWYDGGRNLFLSPPSADTNQLPAETDMQLVCKSMVQWMAKLKELRSSTAEADSKLAQVIKDQFIARVRVATQRKPKDPAAIQRMIAQSQSLMKVQSAIANAAGINKHPDSSAIAQATTTTTESSKATVVPPSFPQGSILVVPHPHHPFRAVPLLPVFANTAVMMPQNPAQQQQVVGVETPASAGVTVSNGNEVRVSTTSVIQTSVNAVGSKEGAVSRENLPKDSPTPAPTPTTIMTIASLPPHIQQALVAAGNLSDSRQPVALPTGIPFVPTMMMTVGEAVPLGTIDFESKSIEITGEVPIRKVELDSLDETSNVADEGRLLPAMSNSKEGTEAGATEGSNEGEIDQIKAAKEKEEPQTPSLTVLQGRTSQEVMSAKMLLSLTGRAAGKDWPISPLDKDAPPQVFLTPPAAPLQPQEGMIHVPATVSITPAISGAYDGTPPTSTPSTPSSRKRKHKPTPSARVSDVAPTPGTTGAKHDGILSPPTTTSKGRRIRKPKQMDDEETTTTTTTPRRDRKRQLKGDSTSREFTPEELLTILGIPPSTQSPSPAKKTPSSSKGRQRSGGMKATREKEEVDAVEVLQGSEASAKMQQLKAERESKPMKEYVIETDSESDSSSSGTSSFSPNSGSSSDSSSDSSSEGGSPSETAKTPQKKGVATRGRGRGRVGGRNQRRRRATGSARSSSSDESSSEEDETNEEKGATTASVKRGRGRGRGRGGAVGTRGRRQSRGQIVSIPTSLLTQPPLAGKKRRSSGHEADDKDRRRLELIPEGPIDLASFYSNQGGVDLGTLSELTQSVKHSAEEDAAGSGSRSKRTCVRVREEISKLQEILEDIDTEDPKAVNAVGAKPKGRGRGRGQASGGGVSNEVGREGSAMDVGSADLSVPAVRKYRRPAYRSQFTHKRRKKRKKQPEEEALWQPARKRPAGETLRPIYVFSTHLANKAAEWVIRGKYDNIIQFHNAQPKGPGFLRLPEAAPQKPPVGGETETKTGDRGRKLTETTDSEDTPTKGSKPAQRRSSRLSTDESRHESPRVTRLRSHKNVSQSADSEEPDAKTPPPSAPPPPVRSSRRLRSRQQPGSVSPPPPSPPPPESPPPPAPSRRTRSRAPASETPPQRVTRSRRALSPKPQAESPSAEGEADTEEQEEAVEENERSEGGGAREEPHQGEPGAGGDHRREEDGGGEQRPDDRSSGLQSPPLDMVGEGPYGSDALSETNYTICHGTASTRSPSNDISSPSSRVKAGWPQQQQQPRQPQSVRTPTTPVAETYSPSGSSVAAPALGRPVAPQSPGVNATESVLAQHLTQDHHRDVNWGHANITPQFPPVPGGYPSVYNPGLHTMPYPPPGQTIPGANYPYPMPYPWPHAHAHGVTPAHMGGSHPKSYHDPQAFHAQEMLQQQQRAAAEGVPHSQHLSHHHHHHHQYPPSSLIQTWSSQQPTPSLSSRAAIEATKEPMTSFSPQEPTLAQAQPIVKSPAMEKLPLGNAQTPTGYPPPPTLHQLPTPGSQPSLSHHVPHGFARGPHALSPEHIHPGASPHPHAAFPYPFEPGPHHALSPMHMWQQSQMQAPPIRHIPGMHPAAHIQPHHLHPHGMWYPLMPGVDPAGAAGGNSLKPSNGKKGGKSGGSKAVQMDGAEKINVNRNVNNNNNGIASIGSAAVQSGSSSSQSLYAAQYQAQAFSQRQQQAASKRSSSGGGGAAFSVEQLTSSNHKEPAAYSELLQSHIARGSTWTPPAHQSETHRDFSSKLGSAVISVQSTNAQPATYHSASANQNLPYLHALPKRQGSITVVEDNENMATSAVLERTRRNTEMVGEMVSSVATFPS